MRAVKPVTWGFLAGAIAILALLIYGLLSLGQMTPSHVVRINRPDPALVAAIKEAKKGLDEFIKELATPKDDERFAVKGTFQTLSGPEYLWVRRPVFKDGAFSGILDQQPIALKGKNKGDSVTFAKKDAVDWMIKDDQGMKGMFTEKALGSP